MTVEMRTFSREEVDTLRPQAEAIMEFLMKHDPATATVILTMVTAHVMLNYRTPDNATPLTLLDEFVSHVRQWIERTTRAPAGRGLN
jgi:DNA gyrase/topoisomerase IV subunit A